MQPNSYYLVYIREAQPHSILFVRLSKLSFIVFVVKFQEMFEQMDVDFGNGLFGYLDILVDEFQALFSLLVLQAILPIYVQGSQQSDIDVKRDAHVIDERQHLLVDQHVLKHRNYQVLQFQLDIGRPTYAIAYI